MYFIESFSIFSQMLLKWIIKGPVNCKFAICSGNGLVSNRPQMITQTNDNPVHKRI